MKIVTEQNETPTNDVQDKNLADIKLGNSIKTALEAEKLFKLYSYRIISPDDFNQFILQLAEEVIQINHK